MTVTEQLLSLQDPAPVRHAFRKLTRVGVCRRKSAPAHTSQCALRRRDSRLIRGYRDRLCCIGLCHLPSLLAEDGLWGERAGRGLVTSPIPSERWDRAVCVGWARLRS